MIWHHSHDVVDRVMLHYFDGKTWNQFNSVCHMFLMEPWNVNLSLCIYGFNPFRSFVSFYSYWLIILTVYNFLKGSVCSQN